MNSNDLEPLTLYPDRRPALSLAVGSMAMLTLAGWLAWRGGLLWAACAGGIGTLGLVIAAIWLVPSRSYLHLGDRGFSYCSGFQARRVDWRDVQHFEVVQIEGQDRVAWNYSDSYPADLIPRQQCRARTGFEAILPQCCGTRSAELVVLLNQRRKQART